MEGNEAHAEELVRTKQRRLQELERQQAFLGALCPPHITMEIDDLRTELANIELGASVNTKQPKQTITPVDNPGKQSPDLAIQNITIYHLFILARRGVIFLVAGVCTLSVILYRLLGGVFFASDVAQKGRIDFISIGLLINVILIVLS